jgi:hypothetical protein
LVVSRGSRLVASGHCEIELVAIRSRERAVTYSGADDLEDLHPGGLPIMPRGLRLLGILRLTTRATSPDQPEAD